MPSYTVPINGPNGPGFMTVNASSPKAAAENASQGGNYATGNAQEGGQQAHTGTGGEAVAGYPAGFGPSGQITPSTATPTQTTNSNDAEVQKLGNQINSLMGAIATGNKEAFDEAVRQFNLSFGLDTQKFSEAVRQFNENLQIAQSGVTGAFQGAPTMQMRAQQAQLYGTEAPTPGQQTLAAQAQNAQLYGANAMPTPGQQTLAAQQQGYAQNLGLVTTAAGLQANPFRQAQVIGQLGNLVQGGRVAGFQAPGAAQGQTDFSGMGNLQRMIDDIRGGPGAINSQTTQSVLGAIPTPNKLNSVDFYRSSPLTQNLVLQGMQEKYGLSPDDALAQIKNTLPQFQAPTTFGGVKR